MPVGAAGDVYARENEADVAAGSGNASLMQVPLCAAVPVFVAVSRGQVWEVVQAGFSSEAPMCLPPGLASANGPKITAL